MILKVPPCTRLVLAGIALSGVVLIHGCAGIPKDGEAQRGKVLSGTRATYCRPPRTAEQRVDVPRLISELKDLHANTYSFCIHNFETDWDDLKSILPAARAQGIRVWASLVPPSESPPRTKKYSEPFRLDYKRWAVEFARLSLNEPNLVAWSIDDFNQNLKFYTPAYLREMLGAARAINPKLAFVPCVYYKGVTPEFATNYAPLLDGILFPYRHESGGANLKEPDLVEAEIDSIKEKLGAHFPVILDIYATAHSRLGATTPEYVEQVMMAGHRAADGVMIYCHQDPETDAPKYQVIKKQFSDWSR
jgi:hypothetical protein